MRTVARRTLLSRRSGLSPLCCTEAILVLVHRSVRIDEMIERFTDRARRVIVLAQEEARMLNHNYIDTEHILYIDTEHILLGLIHEGEGVAAKALESLGISLKAVRQHVQEIIGQGQQAPSGHIRFTPQAKNVLELSRQEAVLLGHNYIGTEHLLIGLIREGEGVAAQVLVQLGADLNTVRRQVIQLAHGHASEHPASETAGVAAGGTSGNSKQEGEVYSIEEFDSICDADDFARAYRGILASQFKDALQKLGMGPVAHYIMRRSLGLSYDLVAMSPTAADNPRLLEAAYARLERQSGPGDIWYRVRSKDNPNFVAYFRESPDGSGKFMLERPASITDEELIDFGLDEILSCRKELVAVASLLQRIKATSTFTAEVVPFEILASCAYRASDPNFNVRIWHSGQMQIRHALQIGNESPLSAYSRFRCVVRDLRSSCGADGDLTAVVEAIGRLSEILDNDRSSTETTRSVDLLERFASWEMRESAARVDKSPSKFLRSLAATLIIRGDEAAVREVAESFLAEGDELVERALDSQPGEGFLAALYNAVPPLIAALCLFDALSGLRQSRADPFVMEIRSALAENDRQAAAISRGVADEVFTRVLVSIHRNALDLAKKEYQRRDQEELKNVYGTGGQSAVKRLIAQFIEYEFSYPRALAEELLTNALQDDEAGGERDNS